MSSIVQNRSSSRISNLPFFRPEPPFSPRTPDPGITADERRQRGQIMRDQIGEVARARLLASPHSAIRSIGCSCHDGVLTLRGTLSNYHQKQLALAIVADIEGVQGFVDKIQVASRLSGE